MRGPPVDNAWPRALPLFRAPVFEARKHHEEVHILCRQKDGKVKPSKQEQDAAKRREQMAAAAEARIARLQLVSEQQQLWC